MCLLSMCRSHSIQVVLNLILEEMKSKDGEKEQIGRNHGKMILASAKLQSYGAYISQLRLNCMSYHLWIESPESLVFDALFGLQL